MGRVEPFELDISKTAFLEKLNELVFETDLNEYKRLADKKKLKLVEESVSDKQLFLGELKDDHFDLYVLVKKFDHYNELISESLRYQYRLYIKEHDSQTTSVEAYGSTEKGSLDYLFPFYYTGATRFPVMIKPVYIILFLLICLAVQASNSSETYLLYSSITLFALIVLFNIFRLLNVLENRSNFDQNLPYLLAQALDV